MGSQPLAVTQAAAQALARVQATWVKVEANPAMPPLLLVSRRQETTRATIPY